MIPAQSNPYQQMLADALRAQGTSVRLGSGPGRSGGAHHAGLDPRRYASGHPSHWMYRYLAPMLRADTARAARRTALELRCLRRLGVRVIWTMHNVGEHDGQGNLESRFNRRLVSLADAVICHCSAARQLAVEGR